MFEDQIKMVSQVRETYADKFMHQQPTTPIKLIKDITDQIPFDGNASVLVMFTIEWALYLKHVGYKDVTVAAQGTDAIAKFCQYFGFKYINLDEKNNKMKFDVVVGNPPYQNGKDKQFYQQFVIKAFEIAPIVAMVTPSGWVSASGKNKKFFNTVIGNRLTSYKFLGDTAFDAQIITVYFICNRLTPHNSAVVNGCEVSDVNVLSFLPAGGINESKLVQKIQSSGVNGPIIAKIGTLYRKDTVFDELGIKCIASAGREGGDYDWNYVSNIHLTNGQIKGHGLHKVVFSGFTSIGKLGAVKYAGPDYACGAQCLFIEVPSEQCANNLIAYLNSKIFKFCIKVLKSAVCSNSRNMLKSLPAIDFTRAWTDSELYAHFNLTQDEIDLIESTVK